MGIVPRNRRIPSAWIVGLSILVLALPFGGMALAFWLLTEQKWERMQVECRTKASEIRARDGLRPPLRGVPTLGNAWTDYKEAAALLHASKLIYKYGDFPSPRGEMSSEELRVWSEPGLPALERLRRGPSRAESRRDHDWENHRWTGFAYWRFISLGLVRASLLAEQGDAREAAELLLDLMRMCCDTARDGPWGEGITSHYHLGRLLQALKALMDAGLLDRHEMREIARQLGLLEAELPRFDEGMLVDALGQGFQVLRAQTLEALLKEFEIRERKVPLWRRGTLGRLTMIKAVEIQQAAAVRMAEGDSRPWTEARRTTRQASAEIQASGNYLLTLSFDPKSPLDYSKIQKLFREGQATLRLVRAAALYRADGVLPDADDPCGTRLGWSKKGHVLRIWSAGADGVDDGGSGTLDPKLGRDLVVEVRR